MGLNDKASRLGFDDDSTHRNVADLARTSDFVGKQTLAESLPEALLDLARGSSPNLRDALDPASALADQHVANELGANNAGANKVAPDALGTNDVDASVGAANTAANEELSAGRTPKGSDPFRAPAEELSGGGTPKGSDPFRVPRLDLEGPAALPRLELPAPAAKLRSTSAPGAVSRWGAVALDIGADGGAQLNGPVEIAEVVSEESFAPAMPRLALPRAPRVPSTTPLRTASPTVQATVKTAAVELAGEAKQVRASADQQTAAVSQKAQQTTDRRLATDQQDAQKLTAVAKQPLQSKKQAREVTPDEPANEQKPANAKATQKRAPQKLGAPEATKQAVKPLVQALSPMTKALVTPGKTLNGDVLTDAMSVQTPFTPGGRPAQLDAALAKVPADQRASVMGRIDATVGAGPQAIMDRVNTATTKPQTKQAKPPVPAPVKPPPPKQAVAPEPTQAVKEQPETKQAEPATQVKGAVEPKPVQPVRAMAQVEGEVGKNEVSDKFTKESSDEQARIEGIKRAAEGAMALPTGGTLVTPLMSFSSTPVPQTEETPAPTTKEAEPANTNTSSTTPKVVDDATKELSDASERQQNRTAGENQQQQNRQQQGQTRGTDAKLKAAQEKQQREQQREQAATEQMAQMKQELEQHAELAVAALDKTKEQLAQELQDRIAKAMDALGKEITVAEQEATAKWNEQKPKVKEAFDAANQQIDKDCDAELDTARQNTNRLKTQLANNPQAAAKEALALGQKDADRYADTRDQRVQQIKDDGEDAAASLEKAGAAAQRVKLAQAGRETDGVKKAHFTSEATQQKQLYDEKAKEARDKAARDADAEQTKYDGLITKRQETAKKTHDDILKHGKEYAGELEKLYEQTQKDIEALRTQGKQLAKDRFDQDERTIETDLQKEIERLRASLVDQKQKLDDDAQYAINSLQSMSTADKDKAKADIKRATDEGVAAIDKAKWADLQGLQLEVQDAHSQIDTGISKLGMRTVAAVRKIAAFQQSFHNNIEATKKAIENRGLQAVQSQQAAASSVASGLARTRSRGMDRSTTDAERTQRSTDIYEDLAAQQKAATDQKQADQEKAQRRQTELASFRDPQKDALNDKNAADQAKAKIFESCGRWGINPDKAAIMQHLATLTPEQVALVSQDPRVRECLGGTYGGGDLMTRIEDMSKAGTPEEVKAQVLSWSFHGGLKVGTDDATFKKIMMGPDGKTPLTPAERQEIDRLYQANGKDNPGAVSIDKTIDSEMWTDRGNNMMKAYWQGPGAAMAEEQRQASDGGLFGDARKFVDNNPWVAGAVTLATFGATAPLFYKVPGGMSGLDQLAGYGTSQDNYVAQMDKLREMTEPPANATADQIRECDERRRQIMGEAQQWMGQKHGVSLEQMDTEMADSPYAKAWMKNQDTTTFKTMLSSGRSGDWDTYGKNKSAYAVETALGNRNWLAQEQNYRAKRDPKSLESLKDFLGKRVGPNGTYEQYIDANVSQPVDRGFFKSNMEEPAERGSEKWKQQLANKLVYAQFGGRTGWGDDRAEMQKIVGDLSLEEKQAISEVYKGFTKEYGLTENGFTQQNDMLGPLKVLNGSYWLGNWSSGNLDEDVKLSYGGQMNDWPVIGNFVGKGRDYAILEYQLKHGKPTTIDQAMDFEEYKRSFDTQSGILNDKGRAQAGELADERFQKLKQSYEELKAQGITNLSLDSPEALNLSLDKINALSQFQTNRDLVDTTAQAANAVQRGLVDGVFTVVTTAVTVIATGAIMILTAGTATPFLVAALASAAVAAGTGLALMGVKGVVLGNKYSGGEAKNDFAAVVIDAIVSGITAGNGVEAFAKNIVGRLQISSKVAQNMLKGLIDAAVSSGGDLSKFLLDEKTYLGSPEDIFRRIREKTAQLGMQTAGSGVISGWERTNKGWSQALVTSAATYDPNKAIDQQITSFAQNAVKNTAMNAATNKGTSISKNRYGDGGALDTSTNNPQNRPVTESTTVEPTNNNTPQPTTPVAPTTKQKPPADSISVSETDTVEVTSTKGAKDLEQASKQDSSPVKKVETGTYEVKTSDGPIEVSVPAETTTDKVVDRDATTDAELAKRDAAFEQIFRETEDKPTDSLSPELYLRDAKKKSALKAEADPRLNAMSEIEKAAVYGYTSSDAADVNKGLRGLLGDGANQEAQQYAKVASEGLDQLDAVPGTFTRMTTMKPEVIAQFVKGATLVERAFTSTSKLDREGLAKIMIDGNVEMLVTGTSGRDVSTISKKGYEQEVLFKPETAFEVQSVQVVDGRTVIKVIEVPAKDGAGIIGKPGATYELPKGTK